MINHSCRLTLQFHITGKCNLRCRHCYRSDDNREILSLNDIYAVFEQFFSLSEQYNYKNRIKEKPHVNLTGGEPLMREDIFDILDFIGTNRHRLTAGILTNGTPIDESMIESIKRNRISFIQMSIDGNREIHDSIRAPGDYDRTFATAQSLHQNGVKTMISFTANRENFSFLPEAAKECGRCGVTKLWSDRMVPIGSGRNINFIDRETMLPYLFTLQKTREICAFPDTEVAMDRALQFLATGDKPYACSAGISLITVDEFGEILPCRRMPISCGNIFDTTLEEVYFHHKTFRQLRKEGYPEECAQCECRTECRGGARCQSYAVYNDFNRADPACPIRKT